MKVWTPPPGVMAAIDEMISNIRKQGFEVLDLDEVHTCAIMGAGLMSEELNTALERVRICEEALTYIGSTNHGIWCDHFSDDYAKEALTKSSAVGAEGEEK